MQVMLIENLLIRVFILQGNKRYIVAIGMMQGNKVLLSLSLFFLKCAREEGRSLREEK
jgi:hypothetical protein